MNPSENNYEDEAVVNESNPKQWLMLVGGLLVVALVVWLLYSMSGREASNQSPGSSALESAVTATIAGGDLNSLASILAAEAGQGNESSSVAAGFYWLLNRYFTNGGNLNEIMAVVDQHPELAFMTVAETEYTPLAFAAVRNGEAGNFSNESLIALLSYGAAVDQAGYGSIPLWGMLAFKNAELARVSRPNPADDAQTREDRAGWYFTAYNQTLYFLSRVEGVAANYDVTTDLGTLVTDTGFSNIDIIVGLAQYGFASILHSAIDNTFAPLLPADTLFPALTTYTNQVEPGFTFFVAYGEAANLAEAGTATSENVARPLTAALASAQATSQFWRTSPFAPAALVVASRTVSQNGMYARRHAQTLARLNPEFKSWLQAEGWTASDF